LKPVLSSSFPEISLAEVESLLDRPHRRVARLIGEPHHFTENVAGWERRNLALSLARSRRYASAILVL
jgi:hypothetical protein